MPAAVVQIQAKGPDDVYLTQNPEIDIFKYSYYRFVNYAAEMIPIPLNDNVTFDKKTFVKIEKYGHLLSKLYLRVKLPPLVKNGGTYACWADNLGLAIFSDAIELEIGGVIVDKIYPQFMDMWDELTNTKQNGRNMMTLKSDLYSSGKYNATKEVDLVIPLDFWFTKRYNSAFPLVAMFSQDIKINFYFRKFNECINYDGDEPEPVSIIKSELLAEYLFVDDVILDRYVNNKHTYIMEQIQFQGDELIPQDVTIYNTTVKFNKPCKEIVFACVDKDNYDTNNYFNYGDINTEGALVTEVTLLLDGRKRFENLPEIYYRSIVPDSVHSNIPLKYIYCIPFSIRPEDNQPTGLINIDRFTDVTISINLKAQHNRCKLYVYGICYNLVTIENGFLRM